jgi:hypothetical protein
MSWEDAFQYPVPVVRELETRLRSSANDNREKLRTLVGASYRSLLDTAETIVDMEVRMQHVEANLARVGKKCNSRGVDRISSNAATMVTQSKARDIERYAFASQLSVLRSCPNVIGRLVKRKESYLLAAKVLVIARLLYKALSQFPNKPPFLDQIQHRLSTLRRALLNKIDKHLSTTQDELPMLVESMSAYSLATSSTPTDVLRHFHHIRLEEIVNSLKREEDVVGNGVYALNLCLRTCKDTQAIFPRRLAESLAKLKIHPLVQDRDVQALHELSLDVHGRWISDEARNYTPWPRHDELQRAQAERLLSTWSKQAISAFLTGITAELSKLQDLRQVARLRQELIEALILSGVRMPGLKKSETLDSLRAAINLHLGCLVRSRTGDIRSVVAALESILQNWPPGDADVNRSLWTGTTIYMDITDGAQSFKFHILNTYQGRDEAVTRVMQAYEKWADSVLEVKSIVKLMKDTRWDDAFADDSEDSDDESSLNSRQANLSNDDPVTLEETARDALVDALKCLQKDMTDVVGQLLGNDPSRSIPQVIFVLRIMREVGDRVPKFTLQEKTSIRHSSPFKSTLLDPLYNALATFVVQPAVETYARNLELYLKGRHNQEHVLWEGNPPLPVQPSPATFGFLHRLCKRMGACGSDLWAPDATDVLRTASRTSLFGIWEDKSKLLTAHVGGVNGTQSPANTSEPKKEHKNENENQVKGTEDGGSAQLKQLLFDMFYMLCFLDASAAPKSAVSLDGFARELCKQQAIDDDMRARLRKNASDYSKRTYLLFALLS